MEQTNICQIDVFADKDKSCANCNGNGFEGKKVWIWTPDGLLLLNI